MSAFLFLADKRLSRESHRQLSIAVLSQSGDDKEIKKQFETWERGD